MRLRISATTTNIRISNLKHSVRVRFGFRVMVIVRFSFTFHHTRKIHFYSHSTRSKL